MGDCNRNTQMEDSCSQEILKNQEMKNRSYADAVRNLPQSRSLNFDGDYESARIKTSAENGLLWQYLLENDPEGFGCHLKGSSAVSIDKFPELLINSGSKGEADLFETKLIFLCDQCGIKREEIFCPIRITNHDGGNLNHSVNASLSADCASHCINCSMPVIVHSIKCAEFIIVDLNSGLIHGDHFEISPELNIRGEKFYLTGAIKHKHAHAHNHSHWI